MNKKYECFLKLNFIPFDKNLSNYLKFKKLLTDTTECQI